jgi:hypothetical protein
MCVNVHYIVLHDLIFIYIVLHIYMSLSIHLYLHLHFSKKNAYTYSQCKSLKHLHAQHWFKSS